MKRPAKAAVKLPATALREDGDLFALMLSNPVAGGDGRFLIQPEVASQESSGERKSHQEVFRSVVTYTQRKKSSDRLHPIDAKRQHEKSLKEIKRGKNERRTARQKAGRAVVPGEQEDQTGVYV